VSRGRAIVRIRVTPRSGRTGVSFGDGHLAVRVRAPAEGGKATEEALRALADWLGFARSSLELLAGATSRLKTVAVAGIEAADLRKLVTERLGRLL
jgi:uncharacterized protein